VYNYGVFAELFLWRFLCCLGLSQPKRVAGKFALERLTRVLLSKKKRSHAPGAS
jgi:hypothetical protein